MPAHAASLFQLLDVFADAERERLGAVAVARDQDALTGLRALERSRELHQREGNAGVAEPTEERVLQLPGVELQCAEHEWYWFPQQTLTEVSMLKCYDSVTDGSVSRYSFHTACIDPTAPDDAPCRKNVVVRSYVFF